MSPKAFGLTLFCEDFRMESTGKHMYIGVYTTVMNVHAPFPFVIPKFVFAIHYAEQPDTFSDDLSFRIFLPGDPDDTPSIEVPVPKESRKQKIKDDTLSADDEQLLRVFIPIVAQPLVLMQEGRIRVRAVCGDFTAKLGTLRVAQQLPQTPPI